MEWEDVGRRMEVSSQEEVVYVPVMPLLVNQDVHISSIVLMATTKRTQRPSNLLNTFFSFPLRMEQMYTFSPEKGQSDSPSVPSLVHP